MDRRSFITYATLLGGSAALKGNNTFIPSKKHIKSPLIPDHVNYTQMSSSWVEEWGGVLPLLPVAAMD